MAPEEFIVFLCFTSGPGAYNITGMGSDSMRKAYIESTRRGVFGTTSVRTNAITKKDDTETPGPNHYQIKEKPFKSRYNQLSSTFASVTARLKDEPIVVKVGKEIKWTSPLMLCMHAPCTLLYTELVKNCVYLESDVYSMQL